MLKVIEKLISEYSFLGEMYHLLDSYKIMYILSILIKIFCILLPLTFVISYFIYVERKVIGAIQSRIGPNRVGPLGLFQPIADTLKLLLKEIIIPKKSNRYLFILAPMLAVIPALLAWAVIPFDENLVLANINVGLLYILAMASLGTYGIVLAGWASYSRYSYLGAIRAGTQILSYEIALSFTLLGVVMVSKSLNLFDIVLAQKGGIFSWNWLPLFPLFIIFWICAVCETNRAPFDVAECEAELVAGFHTEYSGIMFSLFFLAEYANMILVSFLAAIMFFGGWYSPFGAFLGLNELFNFVPGFVWLLLKAFVFMITFLWFRATFPRYRYDQIMRLGWKVFIPLSFLSVVVLAFVIKLGFL